MPTEGHIPRSATAYPTWTPTWMATAPAATTWRTRVSYERSSTAPTLLLDRDPGDSLPLFGVATGCVGCPFFVPETFRSALFWGLIDRTGPPF